MRTSARILLCFLMFPTSACAVQAKAKPLPDQAAVLDVLRKAAQAPIRFQIDEVGNVTSLTLFGDVKGMAKVNDDDLVILNQLPFLTSLDLSKCRQLTDNGLKHLAPLKQLDTVVLNRTGIKGSGLAHLTKLPLKFLSLRYLKLDNDQLFHLAELTGLELLDLHGTAVSDKGLQHLSNLAEIRKLNLSETRITDDGTVYLRTMTKLEDLTLPSGVSDRSLLNLSSMNHLERISMGRSFSGDAPNRLTCSGVIALFESQGRTIADAIVAMRLQHRVNDRGEVISLSISGSYSHPIATNALINDCNRIETLESLFIRGYQTPDVRINDDGIRQLDTSSNLKTIGLRGTDCTDDGILHLTKLQKLENIILPYRASDASLAYLSNAKNLKSVWIRGYNFTDHGLSHLVTLSKLARIEMMGSQFTDQCAVYLGKILSLRELSLVNTRISGAGLINLGKLTGLIKLDLKGSQINDAELHHLEGLTNLESFSTMETNVTRLARLHLFKELQGRSTVDTLKLEGAKLTYHPNGHVKSVFFNGHRTNARIVDQHLALLSGLAQLEELKLYRQDIASDAFRHLAKANQLKRLILYRCDKLDDRVTEHLEHLTSLERLSLSGKDVTDDGIKRLKALTTLRSLSLRQTKVTDDGIRWLRSQLPDCRIGR